jgi:hypothetical protein
MILLGGWRSPAMRVDSDDRPMHSDVVDVVWNTGLMVALATTIGLLATALFRIDAKIDGLGTRLERVEDRLSRVELRLEQHLHLHSPH